MGREICRIINNSAADYRILLKVGTWVHGGCGGVKFVGWCIMSLVILKPRTPGAT